MVVFAHGATAVGPKGRVLIPAEVRNAAHLDEGVELMVHAEASGRVVIETRESVRQRVWEAAAGRGENFPPESDVRAGENSIADRNAAARSAGPFPHAETNGAALLAFLGVQ